jgi:hypothetical protein
MIGDDLHYNVVAEIRAYYDNEVSWFGHTGLPPK